VDTIVRALPTPENLTPAFKLTERDAGSDEPAGRVRPPGDDYRGSQTRIGPPPSSAGGTPPGSSDGGRPASFASVLPGTLLGPYRLVERIGRGRQAEVWRARRTSPPGDEVALKVLAGAAASRDPRKLAQLRREAERGTRLTSPSLLPTYDFGEEDGLAFLAMPLVEGCPLGVLIEQRRSLAEGGIPATGIHPLAAAGTSAYVRGVVGLLASVARAVAVAHDARVVHRDIKPMNILIGRRVEPLETTDPGVYLCDFGLARDLDVATPQQLRDGAGSPLYMAPERLLKRQADEVRCDVYALGVTLFEALSLSPPFDVPPEMPPVRWAQYLATATPPDLGDVAPGVSIFLCGVVRRAMNPDPDRRHPTALRLAYDLERSLSRDSGPAPGRRAGARLASGRAGNG